MHRRIAVAVLAALAFTVAVGVSAASAGSTGAVFTMSNAARNKVLVWKRASDGSLSFVGQKATGGSGTGGRLFNSGGIALAPGWLYAVNPGSDSVSVFRVNGTSLTRTDVEPSGGAKPISVAVRDDLVFVLNAGDANNVRGFRRASDGTLNAIAGAAQPLSQDNAKAAQVGFIGNGTELLVTESATGHLTRYAVTPSGAISAPQSTSSNNAEPFGFDSAPDGTIVISEAANHVAGAGTVSSYRVNGSGVPTSITASAATTQTATCWIEVTPHGLYAYASNPLSDSITGFALGSDGSLRELDANGVTAATGANSLPFDMTSSNGKFLYVLAAGATSILAYRIDVATGALTPRPGVSGLPSAASGLVSR